MNLSFYIAKRYLFSKKSHNVINIITGISMVGVGIGTIALVVVLSAFNGLQDLIEDLYSSFDPAIKITINEGKTFDVSKFPKEQIKKLEGVVFYSECLEETVLLKHRDKQSVATIKGIEQDFLEMSGLDSLLVEGELKIEQQGVPMAIVGYGIAYHLSLYVSDNYSVINVYAPKRTAKISFTNPENAFLKKNIRPAGVFTINPDFDEKYMLVPLSFSREVLGYKNEVSSIELGLNEKANPIAIRDEIKTILGNKFTVKTRFELNELIFKTNNMEKWITFLILSFILVIATFNVIGSLTMLIIDKKKDIAILKSMGASTKVIQNIFLLEGILISFIGGCSGLLIGAILCWGQMKFGFIRLSGLIIDRYPVLMNPLDFLAILFIVLSIGFVASILPAKFVVKDEV